MTYEPPIASRDIPDSLAFLDTVIALIDATDRDAWWEGPTFRSLCQTKHCVLSHVAEQLGMAAMDRFQNEWSTSYVIGAQINDKPSEQYPQAHPKDRVAAYLQNLRNGTEKDVQVSTYETFMHHEQQDAFAAAIHTAVCEASPEECAEENGACQKGARAVQNMLTASQPLDEKRGTIINGLIDCQVSYTLTAEEFADLHNMIWEGRGDYSSRDRLRKKFPIDMPGADALVVPHATEPAEEETKAEAETEWAIEFPGGICNISFDPADPEEMLQWIRDGKLVRREVTTGPWIDAVPAPAEPAEKETKADGPRKFRKKPVEVEAMQYDGEDWRSIAQWMAVHGAPMGRTASGLLRIHTLEGEMAAHPGDWIIKGAQGEFYPCKPASFADTFEAASSPVVPAPTEASVIGGAAGALRAALAVVDPHEAGPWEHAWLSVRDLEDCAGRAEALATTSTEWPSLDAVPAHVRTVRDKVGDEYRRVENGGWDFRSSEWQTIISPTADYDEFAPFVAVEEQDR